MEEADPPPQEELSDPPATNAGDITTPVSTVLLLSKVQRWPVGHKGHWAGGAHCSKRVPRTIHIRESYKLAPTCQ
jgi:hypothetical protein